MDYKLTLRTAINAAQFGKELKDKISQIESSGGNIVNVKIASNFKDIQTATVKWKDGVNDISTKYKLVNGSLKDVSTVSTKVQKTTSLWNIDLKKAVATATNYALGLGVVYKVVGEIKNGFEYIVDLNKELTDIQIVSGATSAQIDEMARSYNALAKEMGATTIEIAQGSLEYIRQGKTAEETGELLRSTLVMAKLGNLNTAQSTEYLTSIMNAYKLEISEIPPIVDKIIQVDNTMATSTAELAEALQRSSVSAQQAGVSFDELLAMVGTISSVTRRDAGVIGTALRTIFARFQDIQQGGLDEDAMGINNVEKALQRVGVAIRDDEGQFRNFTSVLEDLFPVWKELDSIEKANIAKALVGVRHRENLLVLLENEQLYRNAIADQIDSEGLALNRYDIYLQNIEASQNKLRASWEAMWQSSIDDEAIVNMYNLGAQILDLITEMGGLLPIVEAVGAALLGFQAPSLIAALTSLPSLLASAGAALFSLPGVLAATAAGLVLVYNKVKKLKEEGEALATSQFDRIFDDIRKKGGSSNDVMLAYIDTIKAVRESQEQAGIWGKIFIDEQELLTDALGRTLEGLESSAKSWDEYNTNAQAAVDLAGLQVDEQGRFYESVNTSNGVLRRYVDGLGLMTQAEWEAANATEALDGWLNKTNEDLNQAANRTVTFEDFLVQAFESAGEEGSKRFNDIGIQIGELNQAFREGTLDIGDYFEQLQLQLENLDMEESFAGNAEAGQIFFTGLVQQATETMSILSKQFDDGEISITRYADQLAQLSDVFVLIGEKSQYLVDGLGLPEEQLSQITSAVTSAMGEIGAASEELRALQELNIMVQDAFVKSTQQTLQFGTEAYNDYMMQIAQAAALSGQSFVDMNGNALTSAEQIYGYLTANAGNFEMFANQTANKTGEIIQRIVNNVGRMLTALGEGIKNFKGQITIQPHISGWNPIQALMAGQIQDMFNLPTITLDIGATGLSMGDIGGMISSIGEDLSNIDLNFDANIYTNPAALQSAAGEASNLADTLGSVSNAFRDLGKNSSSASDEAKESLKDLGDLLDIVVDKIKQEQKAIKDQLKTQLESYKAVIDKRKDLLRSMEKEKQYQDDLKDNQLNLSRIQSEIIELSLDDSEEAQARLLALREEEASAQRELDDSQYEHSIDLQEAALDQEAKNYESFINSQIDAIDQYLSQPGQIVADAMAIIEAQGSGLYESLIDWNRIYGSGIDADIVQAWQKAYGVLEEYKNSLGELDYQNAALQLIGLESPDLSSLTNVPNLSASMLSTPNIGIPEIPKTSALASQGFSVENLMPIIVNGNLDKSVIPDIKKIADEVLQEINNGTLRLGINRPANSFSV